MSRVDREAGRDDRVSGENRWLTGKLRGNGASQGLAGKLRVSGAERGGGVGRWLRNLAIAVLLPALCLCLPLFGSERFRAWAGGGADAVSTASVIVEQPSGKCTVFINRKLHEGKLDVWRDFFEGREVPVIFEDIACVVPSIDTTGQEMAASFQSRLPEHQMEISTEDAILLLSKADYGRCDVLLLSDEVLRAFGGEGLLSDGRYEVVRVEKEEEP